MINKIQYAITECLTKKWFRALVVCADLDSVRNQILSSLENAAWVRNCRNDITVTFLNGSILWCVRPTATARGTRCHMLIIDEAVPEDIKNEVFAPMLRKYEDTLQIIEELQDEKKLY